MYEHEYDIINNFSTILYRRKTEIVIITVIMIVIILMIVMINMIVIMILVMTKIFLYFEGFLSATLLIWIA